jgi:predicted 3-demethylubiquinone-9 3-methyltransferase (glyoxalase superfamily)
MGQPFMAFSAGPLDAFNHSISFMVQCDDQTEIDRLWAALSDGGKVERSGWLKDRYGLYWQIAPSMLGDMMKDRDRMRAKRVAEAMLNVVKLDIERLQRTKAVRPSCGFIQIRPVSFFDMACNELPAARLLCIFRTSG